MGMYSLRHIGTGEESPGLKRVMKNRFAAQGVDLRG
jgi:hypothetical protein